METTPSEVLKGPLDVGGIVNDATKIDGRT